MVGTRRGWTATVAGAVAVTGMWLPSAQAEPGDGGDPAPGPRTGTTAGWSVTPVDDVRVEISWQAPERLRVGADRPVIVDALAQPVGQTALAADGRTVRVLVNAPAPDPATLDVVLSGDRLDEPGDDRVMEEETALGSVPAPRAVLPVDPAKPGPHAVVARDYTLAPVKLARMPQPIEMVGHAVEPVAAAATGPRPLVVFLHGRHGYCYNPKTGSQPMKWPCRAPAKEIPSHLGYDYIQRVLASQGYATVSIRVNGINAQDHRLADGGAGARADIVDRHLAHWATLADARQVDLDRVVLVGHSRGGEGVNRVALRTPLSAGHTIVGQVLLAPTDFAHQSAPYVPTVAVLPQCDGDVSDLQGQRFVDAGRDVVADDTSLKSSVMLFGANHNFFNTEWTPATAAAPAWDDWGGAAKAPCGRRHEGRLSAAEQRRAGIALVAGAAGLFAQGRDELRPMFDGSGATAASLGTIRTATHALGGGRELRRPGSGSAAAAGSPAASVRLCQTAAGPRSRGGCRFASALPSPHWSEGAEKVVSRQALEVAWSAAGRVGGVTLSAPLDLRERRLALRTVVDAERGAVRFGVRLTDASGASAVFDPVGGDRVAALPGGSGQVRNWAQSVLVAPTGAAVDLAQVVRVDLVTRSAKGRLWLLDLAAVGASPLPPAQAKRVPVVDVGAVQVTEGDAPATGTASVPITVRGSLTAPARVRVVVGGEAGWGGKATELTIPAGTTRMTVPVTFKRDNAHSPYPVRTEVLAWPRSGAMTNAYLGALTVVDDDPPPRLKARLLTKKVVEGQPIRIVLRSARPLDLRWSVGYRFVRGPGPYLTGSDIGPWWKRHTGDGASAKALYKVPHRFSADLRIGKRRKVISIPTAMDRRQEGTERGTILVSDGVMKTRLKVRIVDR